MYINPNTTVRLLKGVPLDNTYTDTLYFSAPNVQQSHFLTQYTAKVFDRMTYQRVGKGSLRVQVLADEIYDYNYMMFQNTAYGSKWFYAFITSVEYINDNTSQVNYEIDVMQTWFYEAELQPCWVEREHSATDAIGDSITDEPVATGDYVCVDIQGTLDFLGYSVLVAIARERSS